MTGTSLILLTSTYLLGLIADTAYSQLVIANDTKFETRVVFFSIFKNDGYSTASLHLGGGNDKVCQTSAQK